MDSQDEDIEVRAPGFAVDLVRVSKEYLLNGKAVKALTSITLDVKEGEGAAIVGPSGAGKTTVFNLIAGLEKPSDRKSVVEGKSVDLGGRRIIKQKCKSIC